MSIVENKKAFHDYFIEQRFEAGMVLEGWEVKAIRAGRAQLKEAYVIVQGDALHLIGAHISPLPTASTHVHPDPTRTRKLLLHDRLRFVVAIAGVSVSVMLVLVQVGLYFGFMNTASSLIDASRADIWVGKKSNDSFEFATPFDERSVDLCVEFDMPIIKIASSDLNDWPLIEKIATTKRPVIASTGGATEKDLDDLVTFFENRSIPLAINHCVSKYPSEDEELELNQIDYLIQRYPGHVVGLSTHEYHSWDASMFISYAKGARTWERHVDIDHGGIPVSKYCSVPGQVDAWFKAFNKAREMCGGSSTAKRVCSRAEIEYLDALVRGVYAKRDLEPGYVFSKEAFASDFYLAIPLRKGQLSCREVMNGEKLKEPVKANDPLTIGKIDGPYSENAALRELIENRGH